jgi:hypothetical protein
VETDDTAKKELIVGGLTGQRRPTIEEARASSPISGAGGVCGRLMCQSVWHSPGAGVRIGR